MTERNRLQFREMDVPEDVFEHLHSSIEEGEDGTMYQVFNITCNGEEFTIVNYGTTWEFARGSASAHDVRLQFEEKDGEPDDE